MLMISGICRISGSICGSSVVLFRLICSVDTLTFVFALIPLLFTVHFQEIYTITFAGGELCRCKWVCAAGVLQFQYESINTVQTVIWRLHTIAGRNIKLGGQTVKVVGESWSVDQNLITYSCMG